MEELIQIPGELMKYESKANGAVRLIFDSQEEIPPELITRLITAKGKTGWLTFLASNDLKKKIDFEDVVNLPSLMTQEEELKSPSQRLRAVLYRLWESSGKPTKTSEEFYRQTMEQLIEKFKERL